MIRNFIVLTVRLLWRNFTTSMVNIFSLTTGIVSFIFIMLYVHHESSFDKFNHNFERIYRLEGDEFARLPPSIGTHLKDKLPEIEVIARLATLNDTDVMFKPDKPEENIRHVETTIAWTDSSTFDVFTFPFTKGNPRDGLRRPFTCAITQSVAQTLFGDASAIGKTVQIIGRDFEITGVIQPIKKSHIDASVFLSLTSIHEQFPERDLNNTGRNSWLWSATYLLTTHKIDETVLSRKINNLLSKINDGNTFDTKFKEFKLRPLADIYFHGTMQNLDYGIHGNYDLVAILFLIGVFMLLLACINYINLTTARSNVRTREVAIKRIVGSTVTQVRAQIIAESIIVSIISLIIALVVVKVSLHTFNYLVSTDIQTEEFDHWKMWAILIVATIILGGAAGIYPAIYLTAVRPVKLIKGTFTSHDNSSFPRSVLMTLQFTLSIILIVCALANLRQLEYIRKADLGFQKDHIIQVQTPGDFPAEFESRETFKENLLQIPGVTGVTFSAGSPGSEVRSHPIEYAGTRHNLEFILVDHDYVNVMGVHLIEGKPFPVRRMSLAEFHQQEKIPIYINEAAVRELKITNPIGTVFHWEDLGGDRSYEIIGVIKNFHFRSLHHKVSPLMVVQTPPMSTANIKVQSSNIPATLEKIGKVWKQIYGDRLFAFRFLDEKFDRQYKSDDQLATTIALFTGQAMAIACLGLFALSSFMISRRTKEISIRKSMGASIRSIYAMLSWDFLKWVVIAIVIAFPIAWYLMHLWLNKFAYHIALNVGIFVTAASVAVGISLLTVAWQSFKAATTNPIDGLRHE